MTRSAASKTSKLGAVKSVSSRLSVSNCFSLSSAATMGSELNSLLPKLHVVVFISSAVYMCLLLGHLDEICRQNKTSTSKATKCSSLPNEWCVLCVRVNGWVIGRMGECVDGSVWFSWGMGVCGWRDKCEFMRNGAKHKLVILVKVWRESSQSQASCHLAESEGSLD